MSKRLDQDIKALKGSIRALNCSSNRYMLIANIMFLWDRYVEHPDQQIPDMLAQP